MASQDHQSQGDSIRFDSSCMSWFLLRLGRLLFCNFSFCMEWMNSLRRCAHLVGFSRFEALSTILGCTSQVLVWCIPMRHGRDSQLWLFVSSRLQWKMVGNIFFHHFGTAISVWSNNRACRDASCSKNCDWDCSLRCYCKLCTLSAWTRLWE